MAKLKFYYGTMGAGKTTEALKTFEIYRRKNKNPLITKNNGRYQQLDGLRTMYDL